MTTMENDEAVDGELVIVRVFDAPRALVWSAWTEGERIRHWSAPHGYEITHGEGEARPGVAWRSCMRSPEGHELWLGGVYREVVPGERLSFTHAWEGDDGRPGPETLVTVELADADDGKTRMTFRQTGFTSVVTREGHRGGWEQSFERLDDFLSDA
ncbi:MAG TPA: SRPBCC domain-containing protein [Longimicrobium sp.]|nr:SRPBCC domain-containing protein [Longimicrobium sp.]